jgi:hypothetical protein
MKDNNYILMEVIIMDPVQLPTALPITPILYPGLFETMEIENDFLSSLDSDIREYVISNPSEFTSRDDLMAFVNRVRDDE